MALVVSRCPRSVLLVVGPGCAPTVVTGAGSSETPSGRFARPRA
jgi:hypothetical protein